MASAHTPRSSTPSDGPNLLDEFSDVLPVDPVPMDDPANHQSTHSVIPSRTTPHSNDSSNSPISEDNSASSSSTLNSKDTSPSGEPVSSSHSDPQLVPGVSATPSPTTGGIF